jgi:hypothetical protein
MWATELKTFLFSYVEKKMFILLLCTLQYAWKDFLKFLIFTLFLLGLKNNFFYTLWATGVKICMLCFKRYCQQN